MSASCSPVRIFSHENRLKAGIRGEFQDPDVKQPSSSSNGGSSNSKEEDHDLESAKAEMGEVREENERLKKMLQQVEKDYHLLKLRFFEALQRESSKNDSADPSIQDTEESKLVSLSLGRTTLENNTKKDEKAGSSSSKGNTMKQDEEFKGSLTLGLDSKFENSTNPSPTNSSEQQVVREDEGEGSPPPSKMQKINNVEDEVGQQSSVKRARVCVRARCDTPTMNDGCQWRKYGQKISKGNPCPRAYYRCTVAPACPVRKQVQRCSDDMSILITTYEGTHNHQLPMSATAMASTTSAAASMLLSGSSTSQPSPNSDQLSGFNFNPYNNSQSKQIYLQNPNSPLFPTITLDLTSPPPPPTSSLPFNRFPKFSAFPSSTLSFSSAETQPNMFPTAWRNGYQNTVQPPQALTETLTKAITSDPSFRTVIAAALSSMMGTASSSVSSSGQMLGNVSLGETNQGCGSSLFSGLGLSTVNSRVGNGVIQSNSTSPFCIFNSAAAPAVNKDHKS